MNLRNYYFLVVLVFCSTASFGEITLPAILADNMVLQQKTETPLWGKAIVRSRVTVTTSWDHKTYTTTAGGDGSWKVMVKTPSAGGPYSISLSDGKVRMLNNILIGEVWLCSG